MASIALEGYRLFGRSDQHPLAVTVCLGISLLCHAAVVALALFLPDFHGKREITPSVLDVTMVTLTAPGSAPKAGPIAPDLQAAKSPKQAQPEVKVEKPAPAKPEPPKPAPEVVKTPEPVKPAPAPEKPAPAVKPAPDAISLDVEKAKEKTSLKKETFSADQSLKQALAQIEKKVKDTPPDPLQSTMDRIRASVEKQEAVRGGVLSNVNQAGGQGGDSATGIAGAGLQAMSAMDFYKAHIAGNIEKNWFYNEQLAGGKSDLQAILVIKILANGEVADVLFEKKSGNSFFDESAFKAVKKSSPLPPLPREYNRPYYEVGLVFTPAGLKRG